MENEDICKLVIVGLVLFGIYHFFIKGKLDGTEPPKRDSIKRERPKQPERPKKVQFNKKVAVSSGSKVAEVHFVYAEWCGHSRNAVPDFEKLVQDSSVKTSSGLPVKFVMTEESTPGMAQFKSKIQGFPTYMTVIKNNGTVESITELDTQGRSADAIRSAATSIK
jgi:thiol-disulfide isomerase/thioredoxin